MNDMTAKLSVLAKVGKRLHEHGVTWAVGASMLLYFKGMVESCSDIDLMVAEKDVALVKKLLCEIGECKPGGQDAKYRSKSFLEFVIDGVELDVIAGFTILRNGVAHYFPLEAEQVQDSILVQGVTIPLQSVEQWREYYSIMGREARVQLIDLHTKEKPQRR